MLLQQIQIKNFRNFSQTVFDFNPLLTVVLGDNSRGKTNLLEAIYFVINGEGFRETKENELVRFSQSSAAVEAKLNDNKEQFSYKIILNYSGMFVTKHFFINKAKKIFSTYRRETGYTVLFTPAQIDIIIDSPEVRRRYFDKFIAAHDLNYKKKLTNYEAALRKKNKILERINNLSQLKEELTFWNQYLEDQATYITQKRQAYVDFLNTHPHLDHKIFKINYLKSELDCERLEKNLEHEMKFKRTLIGPQKDDFKIYLEDKDLHSYGSRSEQRLAIFWLKINEINYLETSLEKKPIILLDDVFSELDIVNKKLVLNLIKNYQTILTTTESQLTKLSPLSTSIIKL